MDASELMQKAAGPLQGAQFGVGFGGSPGWVLAASFATTALQSWLARNNSKDQVELIGMATRKLAEADRGSKYIPIDDIENLASGIPSAWRRCRDEPGQHRDTVVWMQQSGTGSQELITDSQIYVHNGAPFVDVELKDAAFVSIEWSHVESIWLQAED